MMVCMSYYGTLKVVDRLCEDHDIEVEFWGDELKTKLDERTVSFILKLYHKNLLLFFLCTRFRRALHMSTSQGW